MFQRPYCSRVFPCVKHFSFFSTKNHPAQNSIIFYPCNKLPHQTNFDNPFSHSNTRIPNWTSSQTNNSYHKRFYSTNGNNKQDNKQDKSKDMKSKNFSVGFWVSAILVATFGLSYAAIPLYRMFCRATGYGGTVKIEDETKTKKGQLVLDKEGKPKEFRQIKVHLNSIVGDNLQWSFKPMQTPVYAIPNEPVLVFYEATNQSDTPVIGVATYNVVPQQAGLYFVKIQCFCFDEQRLKPHETVPMPVLFYIDPKITEDESLRDIDTLTLSYTFYRSDDQEEPK